MQNWQVLVDGDQLGGVAPTVAGAQVIAGCAARADFAFAGDQVIVVMGFRLELPTVADQLLTVERAVAQPGAEGALAACAAAAARRRHQDRAADRTDALRIDAAKAGTRWVATGARRAFQHQ